MVRPHVEYCTAAWSPHYIKDKQLIEKIQCRFLKMIPGFKDLRYETGLKILRLNTLEERRNRADLIFLFKMYIVQRTVSSAVRVTISVDKSGQN